MVSTMGSGHRLWARPRQREPDWYSGKGILAELPANGEVSEWPKDLVLKTSVRSRVPWVRIPPSPPKRCVQTDPVCPPKQLQTRAA